MILGNPGNGAVVIRLLAIKAVSYTHLDVYKRQALGSQGFGPLNAYAFMLFCLLYTPCVAAIGTIRRETHSLKWTAGMVLFQMLLAWTAAVLVYPVSYTHLGHRLAGESPVMERPMRIIFTERFPVRVY